MKEFSFTWTNLKTYMEAYVRAGYHVIRCQDYLDYKRNNTKHKIVVNRVDVDVSVKKVERILDIFSALDIKATFFIRLHANEYNAFSFENYRILKAVRDAGHEIGYHSEIIDQAMIWQENPAICLRRDLILLNEMLGIKTVGVASHGGMTALNNLDFWKNNKPKEFGLLYEAYDKEPEFNLFEESFYISDSSWIYWKAYQNGILIPNDHRTPAEHAQDGHPVIYSLIHPETYYDKHIYE